MLRVSREGFDELMDQLRLVISGYHPVTKDPIAEESDLKDPDVSKLLVLLLTELLTQSATVNTVDNVDYDAAIKRHKYNLLIQDQVNEERGKPSKHNTKWDVKDMQDLLLSFRQGTDVFQLAEKLERTTGSIIGKLRQLKIITVEEAEQLNDRIYKAHIENGVEFQ